MRLHAEPAVDMIPLVQAHQQEQGFQDDKDHPSSKDLQR